MTVTATEFKTNFGMYLEMVNEEDILISKNGKIVAQLSTPQFHKLDALRSLIGIADNGTEVSLDEIKSERLTRQ